MDGINEASQFIEPEITPEVAVEDVDAMSMDSVEPEVVDVVDEDLEQVESIAEAMYWLLAGAALEVGGIAGDLLFGDGARREPSRLTYRLIGMGYEAVQTAESLTRTSIEVARVGWEITRLALPARWTVQIERRVSGWGAIGQREEAAARERVQQTAAAVVDAIIQLVADSPAVRELVQEQVEEALPKLVRSEELDEVVNSQVARLANEPKVQVLVRRQAGQYLDYLEVNSEQVEKIVQGQSVGLANEVLDEVREQTVTADAIVERIVRSFLRRRRRPSTAPALPSDSRSGA